MSIGGPSSTSLHIPGQGGEGEWRREWGSGGESGVVEETVGEWRKEWGSGGGWGSGGEGGGVVEGGS